MKRWQDILVKPQTTLLETMKIIDQSSLQFAIVIDDEQHLLGTVTDGDVRRSILRGNGLEVNIQSVMNKEPLVGHAGKKYRDYISLMKRKEIKQLPIVDKQKKIMNVIFANQQEKSETYNNTVFLMAGGLGTRLRPLTDTIPKPMLHVGNKPILETIIEGFKQYGFSNFVLSVNYKKEIIQEYFQDGSALDVSISYIEETKRMGTAGALSLLKEKPSSPIFVMNGDLLTQVNFEQLLFFHEEQNSVATMCVREYEYQIPYGVIETEDTRLVSIIEKPMQRSFVNAGIYVLNPEALDYIPKNRFFDMPMLFERLILEKKMTSVFPIREYWLDIGQMDDFEKANIEYNKLYS